MDHVSLNKLYSSRPAARKLIDWIREAGVTDGRTTVDELIEDGDIPRRQAIDLLRGIAEAGAGDFKVGRKGHPSRLEWVVDPQVVFSSIVEGTTFDDESEDEEEEAKLEAEGSEDEAEDEAEAAEILAEDAPSEADAPLATAPTQGALDLGEDIVRAPSPKRGARGRIAINGSGSHSKGGTIAHSYVLRADLRVELCLPVDLSRREAEVLAEWVRNLSFER